jgi:hypothetical protein
MLAWWIVLASIAVVSAILDVRRRLRARRQRPQLPAASVRRR